MGERQRAAGVVRFWRAVELFSPQQVPAVRPAEQVFAVRPDRPLPWEARSPLPAARPGHVWQHTVYCGVFAVERVRDVLAEVFPDAAQEDLDGRVGGDSALLAFTVNEDGLLLQDSVGVSTCAWAVGRTRSPGPDDLDWLAGFAEQAAHCERQLLDLGDGRLTVRRGGAAAGASGLLAAAGQLVANAVTGGAVTGLTTLATGAVGRLLDGVVGEAAQAAAGGAVESLATGVADAVLGGGGTHEPAAARADAAAAPAPADEDWLPENLGSRPLTFEGIAAFTAWLAARLGVTADLVPDAARVRSVRVREEHAGESTGQDFLNSFVAEDLERVTGELARGRTGPALTTYLTAAESIDTARRRDVREHPAEVLAGVEPRLVPLGRWPSAADRSLALSQQFAVNTLLAEAAGPAGGALFAVNGPPGTGKTTMLRDVIAALVTSRACALAELASPRAAFGKAYTWRSERYTRTVRRLKAELTGYEMVVASANNGAVENITDEIPARAAIAEQWHDEAAYLSGPARLMLGGAPAWGAVAARLGNRRNRNDFTRSFWWGNPRRGSAGPGPGARAAVRNRACANSSAASPPAPPPNHPPPSTGPPRCAASRPPSARWSGCAANGSGPRARWRTSPPSGRTPRPPPGRRRRPRAGSRSWYGARRRRGKKPSGWQRSRRPGGSAAGTTGRPSPT